MKKLKNDVEVLGLDLSLTGSGWCRIDPSLDLVDYGEVITKPDQFKTRRGRITYIALEIAHQIIRCPTKQTFVFIEGYSFSKKTTSVVQLGELGGVIRVLVFSKTKLDAIEIPNTSLKKFITGSGQGKKEDLKLASYKKYNKKYHIDFEGKSNNKCDAFCIAVMGLALLGLTDKHTLTEKEAIKSTYKYSKYCMDQALNTLT